MPYSLETLVKDVSDDNIEQLTLHAGDITEAMLNTLSERIEDSLLHIAIEKKALKAVIWLIEKGINLNLINRTGLFASDLKNARHLIGLIKLFCAKQSPISPAQIRSWMADDRHQKLPIPPIAKITDNDAYKSFITKLYDRMFQAFRTLKNIDDQPHERLTCDIDPEGITNKTEAIESLSKYIAQLTTLYRQCHLIQSAQERSDASDYLAIPISMLISLIQKTPIGEELLVPIAYHDAVAVLRCIRLNINRVLFLIQASDHPLHEAKTKADIAYSYPHTLGTIKISELESSASTAYFKSIFSCQSIFKTTAIPAIYNRGPETPFTPTKPDRRAHALVLIDTTIDPIDRLFNSIASIILSKPLAKVCYISKPVARAPVRPATRPGRSPRRPMLFTSLPVASRAPVEPADGKRHVMFSPRLTYLGPKSPPSTRTPLSTRTPSSRRRPVGRFKPPREELDLPDIRPKLTEGPLSNAQRICNALNRLNQTWQWNEHKVLQGRRINRSARLYVPPSSMPYLPAALKQANEQFKHESTELIKFTRCASTDSGKPGGFYSAHCEDIAQLEETVDRMLAK